MKSSSSLSSVALAIIFIIFTYILSSFYVMPKYAQSKSEIKSVEKEISDARAKMDSLDASREQLKNIDSTVKSMFIAIPEDFDEANLISEIEAIAVKNQIVLPSIAISVSSPNQVATPTDPTAVAIPTISGTPITISFNASGSFEQLSGLITALEKSIKFMNIKTLSYSTAEDGSLELSLQVEAYSRYIDPATQVGATTPTK